MLNRIFQENCRANGSRTALVFGNDRYTYAELEEQVASCAAALKRLGTTPENGVALVLKNSPAFVFTYLAASRLGSPAFLLDPGSKFGELRRVFTEARIAVAVCEPEQGAPLEQIIEQTGQRFSICPRGEGHELIVGQASEPPPSRIYDTETAIVQYTSGTTGMPKCVARTHGNLFREAANFHETAGVCADDRILCTIPLFHAHGFGNAFMAALYAGATLVLMEEFNRAAVVELLEREQITILPAVPLMFELLSRRPVGQRRTETSLHLAFSAGAPLASAVASEFKDAFGVYVRQLYGSTEVGSAAINLDLDLPSTLESVGLPLKNVSIAVLREDGTPALPGEIGEVAIQSPAMANGYLQQPELTQERFRNGYFFPGDYGRKDGRGYLYIEGRRDWLVLSTGRKIDPREVEAIIATFSKVREVVVAGVPGYLGKQVVKAFVVSREACREQEVVDFCRDRLADYKIPQLVEFVPEIPRNASGKILRKNLLYQ